MAYGRSVGSRRDGGHTEVDEQVLVDVVERHGHEWLPSGKPVTIVSLDVRRRRRSCLAVVEVADGSAARTVVLKTLRPHSDGGGTRQRLVEPAPPADRLAGELEALRRLERLGASDRFFPVAPIELYDDSVLAMDWTPHGSLQELLIGRSQGAQAMVTAFERAGAWLARFHSLAENEPVVPRLGDVAAGIDAAAARSFGRFGGVFDKLAAVTLERVGAGASDVPLGLLHGDMAPRNVLVDDRARVGGIDVAARWRAPVLFDIATFELALRVGRARARSPWRATLDHLVDAFHRGYGLPATLRGEVEIFYALALLDRAASFRLSVARSPGWLLLMAEAHRLGSTWSADG